jgi:hypothetical protein
MMSANAICFRISQIDGFLKLPSSQRKPWVSIKESSTLPRWRAISKFILFFQSVRFVVEGVQKPGLAARLGGAIGFGNPNPRSHEYRRSAAAEGP